MHTLNEIEEIGIVFRLECEVDLLALEIENSDDVAGLEQHVDVEFVTIRRFPDGLFADLDQVSYEK